MRASTKYSGDHVYLALKPSLVWTHRDCYLEIVLSSTPINLEQVSQNDTAQPEFRLNPQQVASLSVRIISATTTTVRVEVISFRMSAENI